MHLPTQTTYFFRNSSCAEDIAISKILSSEITNWERAQYDFRSSGNNFVEFVVDNIPFRIDNRLVFLDNENSLQFKKKEKKRERREREEQTYSEENEM